MSFRFIFVEDEFKPRENLEIAVKENNASGKSTIFLQMDTVTSPDDLPGALSTDCDLVLADVVFSGKNRLLDIVAHVREFERAHDVRQLPIVAYTGWGKPELDFCLKHRNELYDIWDKATASPEYVAWRLSGIAIELSRARPDREIRRRLRQLPSTAWRHASVVKMAERYDAGWTERDQIVRATEPLLEIADLLRLRKECKLMWDSMCDWEFLARAGSDKIRGHARHVLNVYWLGYYLLNEPILGTAWRDSWRNVVADRSGMKGVSSDYREGLNTSWYLAALLHDVGNALEHYRDVVSKLRPAVNIASEWVSVVFEETVSVSVEAQRLLEEIRVDLGKDWKDLVPALDAAKPIDQGIAAALCIRGRLKGSAQPYSSEAARAAAVHNVVGDHGTPRVSWKSDPVMSLLLLCDQIQTWDRERGDLTIKDEEWAHRAELRRLEVIKGKRPIVHLGIDYIPPRHVLREPVALNRLRLKLSEVIRDKPKAVLELLTDWPFELELGCSLAGEKLFEPIRLG